MLDQKLFQVYEEQGHTSNVGTPVVNERNFDSSAHPLNAVLNYSFNDFFTYEPRFFKEKIFKIDRKNFEIGEVGSGIQMGIGSQVFYQVKMMMFFRNNKQRKIL